MLVEFHMQVMSQVLLDILAAVHWGWVYEEDKMWISVWPLVSDDHCWWRSRPHCSVLSYCCSEPQAGWDVSLCLLIFIQLLWLRAHVPGAPVMVFSAICPMARGENHPSVV